MTSEPRLEKLFEPGRIGKMSIKNRVVLVPMVTHFAPDDGYVTDRHKAWYEARAKGGTGLIITEASNVDWPMGRGFHGQLGIFDDRFIPGLKELTKVIHKYGAKVICQLCHAGRAGPRLGYRLPVAPSPIPEMYFEQPRELTLGEIADIENCFVKAAERAKKAGYDGVEIHCAHRYLGAQFLSAATNQRQDAYGGSLKNRARFVVETLQAIKQLLGKDFPVGCRFNGSEYGLDGGMTPEQAQEIARILEEAGTDYLSISRWGMGIRETVDVTILVDTPGANLPLIEGIKKAVSIPVIGVGRLDVELGEKALREGKLDFVGMGRGLIADPELANKAASGKLDDITPCMACIHCATPGMTKVGVLECAVNVAAGKEWYYRITPAEKAKKVLVVGGGPAGMEAARVATLRGHEVTLCEKDQQLGGQLVLAALPPLKQRRVEPFTKYLITQLGKLGVKVEIGKEVTPALIDDMKPDAVIIATGVTPFIPKIPGIGRDNVVTALDVLAGKVEVADSVIVLGGDLVGCETADFLSEKGKKVTITRRGPTIATHTNVQRRRELVINFRRKGVSVFTGVNYEEITDKGLTITKDGQKQTIEADTIVLAAGARPNAGPFNALEGKGFEIYLAGDCVQPRTIFDAIYEGNRIACSL